MAGSEGRYLKMNSEISGYLHLVMKIGGKILLNIAKKYFEICCLMYFTITVNVKQSRYRPGVAQRVSGS